MNSIKEIQQINQLELEKGLVGTSASWHGKYADSAWVYAGNLPLNLSEGDVLCILSQFGEIEDINLVRGDDTGKSRGFAFVKYEDAMSCILAVDNFTGTKVLGRSIGVDHVEKYRLPKELLEKEEANRTDPGHAYQGKDMVNEFSIQQGQDLFAKPAPIETKPEGKEERKEVKRKRKEDRHQHRQEREERREVRAGKQREKRGRRYREGGDDDNNDDKERNRKKKRKKRDRREEL